MEFFSSRPLFHQGQSSLYDSPKYTSFPQAGHLGMAAAPPDMVTSGSVR